MTTMRGQKGFILVFALLIIMLVILVLATLFWISYNDLAIATTESMGMKAYYLAEAGIAQKFMEIRLAKSATNILWTGIKSVLVAVSEGHWRRRMLWLPKKFWLKRVIGLSR